MTATADAAAEIIDRLPGWVVDVIEQRHGQRIAAALEQERTKYVSDPVALAFTLAATVARSVRVHRPPPAPQQAIP